MNSGSITQIHIHLLISITVNDLISSTCSCKTFICGRHISISLSVSFSGCVQTRLHDWRNPINNSHRWFNRRIGGSSQKFPWAEKPETLTKGDLIWNSITQENIRLRNCPGKTAHASYIADSESSKSQRVAWVRNNKKSWKIRLNAIKT